MTNISQKFQFFVLLLGFLLQITFGQNVYQELEVLNPRQREALAKFRNLMLPSLPHDYMKEDIYLIKFLHFNDFNVQKAEQHLTDTLKWRQENQIDESVQNPPNYIAAIEKDFPIYVDGYDKEGRPICEIPFGAWPLRKAAAAGLIKKVTFHTFLNCDEKSARKIREQQGRGRNVTQFVFIANMEGFSLVEHASPASLPLTMNLATGIDRYYPRSAHGLWLINTPDTFATLFRLIRPVLNPSTRAAFKVFTSREAEWKPFLKERVDLNEISDTLGGTKKRNT